MGLLKRLDSIINAPPPHALRVRALVDYYYSHGARLYHSQHSNGGRPLTELVSELEWRQVAPGLFHANLKALEENGPIYANFLKVDPERIKIQVANCREQTGDLSEHCIQERAVAAVSGGYFLYSESDIEPPSQRYDPVGLLLSNGMVHNPPVFRRSSLLIGSRGTIALKPLGLQRLEILVDHKVLKVSDVWNRARGFSGPPQPSVSIVGNMITAVGTSLKIPLNGFVLPVSDTSGLKPGDPVQYKPPRMNETEYAVEGIAGGPMIVSQGRPVLNMREEDFWGITPPVTFSQDETGDQNLLARLAVGLDAENHLIFAAVDGRNFESALGMTLGEIANLMVIYGCHTAINLDGGSSKRMLVNGEVVDLPSTELVSKRDSRQRIRHVYTAILLSSL